MEKYEIEITKEALRDMEEIYNYIANELLSPDNAIYQYNRIAESILQLDIFPEKFRILESNIEKQKEIRRMPVDNYSVFYVIKENRVIVISVLYSASNIQAKLKTNL
ncbi:MAG: type II toxin-antitoxin system RelE/ParE family toxin [Lachnospiraceae bacterium]|nr:type II toxin-antitoxin system RelE/ParE family toxin [Lachnospiraceae bacterium]